MRVTVAWDVVTEVYPYRKSQVCEAIVVSREAHGVRPVVRLIIITKTTLSTECYALFSDTLIIIIIFHCYYITAVVITYGTVKAYGHERRVRISDIIFFISSIMLFNFSRENDVHLHHVTDKCRNGVLCYCGCCCRTYWDDTTRGVVITCEQ